MGKAKRWFRALLGAKKSSASPATTTFPEDKKKSSSDASSSTQYMETPDANKHAIAVAAATAAVAEAALAAAKAAAEVVRMTSGGSRASTAYSNKGGSLRQRESAALKIQSAFRAYLARRALRALKGLVKLQALVRGHIVRKQSTNMLQRMQAMARIQARACAKRAYMSETPNASSSHYQHRYSIKGNVGSMQKNQGLSWFDWWMEKNASNSEKRSADDEKSDKILEIDIGKPHTNPRRGITSFRDPNEPTSTTPFESLSRHSTKSQKPNTALRTLNFPQEVIDQAAIWTTESSPQVNSVVSSRPGSSNRRGPSNSPQVSSRPGSSNRRGPFTPARSECARSLFGEYLSYPNYMANTESSRAKLRSQSAPRQRMEFERPSSTKMFVRGFWDVDNYSDMGSNVHAYPWNQGQSAYSSGDYGSRI